MKHILLIDDSKLGIALSAAKIRAGLANADDDYTVEPMSDPVAALEHIKANRDKYDLICTDLQMPVLSGIELAKGVRQEKIDTSILLMSAKSAEEIAKMHPDFVSLMEEGVINRYWNRADGDEKLIGQIKDLTGSERKMVKE